MTLRRTAFLLAILAALIAAPSAVLAAPPNALLGAAATPPAGTTLTPFTLSVQYLSSAGTAAGSVSATVAGRTLSLSLVAGSTTSGTWAVSSRLPAGSWTTTFRASPEKGPQPVLAGPTIIVAAATASTPPAPSPTPDLAAGAEPSSQLDGGGAPSTTTPAPAPAATEASPVAAPTASGLAAPASGAASQPGASGGYGGGSPAPPDAAPSGNAAATPAAPPMPAAAGRPSAAASPAAVPFLPTSPLGDGTEGVWTIMIGGLVAVGAVALTGGAWLFAAGRRRPATSGTNAPLPSPEATGKTTDELLSRRSRSRTRMKPSDDPVLAAMGLDEASRPRSRASQVDRGAAMRDATRRGPRP
ncbi:MAG: hypothetical protein ABI622_04055 [Chloroflexota bacterium]